MSNFFRVPQTQATLAVDAGDGGDTHVDGLAVEFQVDASVLRQAALGDVEVRHDLEAETSEFCSRRMFGGTAPR
jgi:hypothetical protein